MPKNTDKSDKVQKLNKSEREELIELRQRNEYLEAELLYLKKVRCLNSGEKISNKNKTKIVLELRLDKPDVKWKIWLDIAKLPRSSFYEWKAKLDQMNDEELKLLEEIKEIIEESKHTYGYRRVCLALSKRGVIVNHKKVLRIMRENKLLCRKFHRRNRSYSSFKGEIGKIADNILNRRFKVAKTNEVWVSDVSEFKVPGCKNKLYLSPIMDIFNSEIVSFHLDTSPTVNFTNTSLKEAVKRLPEEHNLMVHTDQGFHYQHKSWVKILEDNNIKQSMSRRGNCLDNSPMENFFGLLKQEIFYGVKYNTIDELAEEIKRYIYWYNHHRIKEKLNGLSPIEYRLQTA